MQRVTITIDDDLDAELERFMSTRGYDNRSEAIRDLARTGLQQAAMEISGPRPCVAALVYAYNHEARELPKRLTRDFHKHHDLAQATLHVHLDEESCMEVTVLKGRGSDVQRFADHIIAERGVRPRTRSLSAGAQENARARRCRARHPFVAASPT
jgi:CopG family nickel-responsive transcriptional regulator